MEENDAVAVLASEMKKCAATMINKAKFDRTVKGQIICYLGNNKYQVKINGQVYSAISYDTFDVNEIVFIKIAEGNFNNLIIETSASGKTNVASQWEIEDIPLDILDI